MKSYTDINQSKKLAEILPIESADMHYATWTILDGEFIVSPNQGSTIEDLQEDYGNQIIPCWSLAALHCVASTYCSRLEITLRADKKYNVFAVKDDFVFRSFDDHPDGFDNLVDACYEMVLKLHKQKLL